MQPETLKGGIEVEDPRVFHFRPLRQQPEEQQQLAGIYSRARHKRGKMGRRRNKQEHNPVRLGSCANGPGTHRRERCRAVTHTHISPKSWCYHLSTEFVCLLLFISILLRTYVYVRWGSLLVQAMRVSVGECRPHCAEWKSFNISG